MKDYEINDSTLAILPKGNGNSLVLEDLEEYEIESSPFAILNYSCNYFGSSYLGRKEGAKNILSSVYKLPIVVEDSKNIVFFPTISPEEDACIWLSLNQIKTISKVLYDRNVTLVEFKNGKTMLVNISYKSLENQILRASRLELELRKRKDS